MGHGHAHGSRQPSCSEHPARTPGHPGVSRCTGEHGNGSRPVKPAAAARPRSIPPSVRVPSTSTRSHTAPAPSAGATTDRVTVSPRRPRAPRSRCRARAGAATPSSFITASARASDPAGAAGLSRKVRATGGSEGSSMRCAAPRDGAFALSAVCLCGAASSFYSCSAVHQQAVKKIPALI